MGGNGNNHGEIARRVQGILEELDPERRLALSRQLRSELWDLVSDEDRARLREGKIDISPDGSG